MNVIHIVPGLVAQNREYMGVAVCFPGFRAIPGFIAFLATTDFKAKRVNPYSDILRNCSMLKIIVALVFNISLQFLFGKDMYA